LELYVIQESGFVRNVYGSTALKSGKDTSSRLYRYLVRICGIVRENHSLAHVYDRTAEPQLTLRASITFIQGKKVFN
jgi:hypothetical protein